ncbi:hypothetical protein ACF0H5_014702 [Mactra antiquata]
MKSDMLDNMVEQGHSPGHYGPWNDTYIPGNFSGLLGHLPDFMESSETACSSKEFFVLYAIRPAVEATLKMYLHTCIPESEYFVNDDWTLCTRNDSFDCAGIRDYTEQCKMHKDGIPTTTPGAALEPMVSSTGIILIVIALLIGILIGIVATIVICLMCPSTYRWASQKIGRNVRINSDTKHRQQSAASDYYAAIEDRNNHTSIPLRPSNTEPHNLTTTSEHHFLASHDDVSYSDSGIHVDSRAPAPEPSPTPRLDHQESCDYSNIQTYEQLERNRLHNQSHNYDRIGATFTSPASPVESEHSYFVLEKPKAAP